MSPIASIRAEPFDCATQLGFVITLENGQRYAVRCPMPRTVKEIPPCFESAAFALVDGVQNILHGA